LNIGGEGIGESKGVGKSIRHAVVKLKVGRWQRWAELVECLYWFQIGSH